jgi:hypothetical protein
LVPSYIYPSIHTCLPRTYIHRYIHKYSVHRYIQTDIHACTHAHIHVSSLAATSNYQRWKLDIKFRAGQSSVSLTDNPSHVFLCSCCNNTSHPLLQYLPDKRCSVGGGAMLFPVSTPCRTLRSKQAQRQQWRRGQEQEQQPPLAQRNTTPRNTTPNKSRPQTQD